jgi:HAMP domain-containing protein
MAGNLTSQVRNIADVTTAVARRPVQEDHGRREGRDPGAEEHQSTRWSTSCDLRRRSDARGARGGHRGKLGGQADVQGVAGTWKDLTDSVNLMASNLTAGAQHRRRDQGGRRGQPVAEDHGGREGEILELKATINTMVDQLSSFAAEVTRVAREVGTEGRLGGQAQVRDVSGTWKDLTDNVNFMAGNLTSQVRGIAKVVTAVANGDLKQKLTVEAKGEIAALAETINA